MMQGPGSALSLLAALVGPDVVSTDPGLLATFETDHRQLYRGRALALARPRSTAEVAKILAFCLAQRIAVVPAGGNTSYCGGATPDDSGQQLVLSLARLDRIRAIDTANDTLTAEAGCVLADVQAAAADAGRLFPLSLGSEGSCQIGGNIATNAGGLNVLRYGMTRELVLGLEVVLADGRVLDLLSGLRKDNTGYDLVSLFVGSEGTLGVITAATLRLFPAQPGRATALAAVPHLHAAIELLSLARVTGDSALCSFELLPRIALDLVARQVPQAALPGFATASPWFVLMEFSGTQVDGAIDAALHSLLADATERQLVETALIANNSAQREQFWRLRESVPEAQRRDGASLKHDISIPLSGIEGFLERAEPLVAALAPEGFLVAYGHLGDGNLHFNVNQRAGADRAAFLARAPALQRAVHDLVRELGGSFSAEHGIGRWKVNELERYATPVELSVMRTIKRSLDPHGILNPGKVLRDQGGMTE